MYNNSKQPCALHLFFLGWGGGGGGGGGLQVRVHSAQGTTQFVDHQLVHSAQGTTQFVDHQLALTHE